MTEEAVVRGLRLVAGTTRNVRPANEDTIGIAGWVAHAEAGGPLEVSLPVPAGAAVGLAVVDGMGGHAGGASAARIAAVRVTVDPAEEVQDALAAADHAVRTAAIGAAAGMGATAAVLRVGSGGRCVVGNVGDVRVYRVVDGYAGQVTVDDRPPGGPPGAVTQCLGGSGDHPVLPHVHEFGVIDGDRLLLCSDGVHDTASIAAVPDDAVRLVTELLATAQVDGGDNATVLVVDVVGARQQPAPVPAEPPSAAPAGSPVPPAVPARGRWRLRRRPR